MPLSIIGGRKSNCKDGLFIGDCSFTLFERPAQPIQPMIITPNRKASEHTNNGFILLYLFRYRKLFITILYISSLLSKIFRLN